MPVYKEKSGTWRVNYRFTDWTGANKQTTKRRFATRREAVAWEKEQSIKRKASPEYDLRQLCGSLHRRYEM